MLALQGQNAAARDAFQRSLEISPEQSYTPYQMGFMSLLEGQPAAALVTFQRSTSDVFRLAGAALAEHDLGHTKDAQAAFDQLIAKWRDSAAFQIAEVHAWWGDKDHAFEWLERARVQRDGGLVLVKTDPTLRSLRGDPRYAAFLKKINLPVD